jgi:hypothetical protein
MTAFKNTIVGKLLKGVGKVVGIGAAVAGTVATGGALAGLIPAVATGTGLIGKVVSGINKVSRGAVNLVTGTTKTEREQVRDVKAEAKAAQDKLDQVERLVNAGATRTQAEQMVGITPTEMGAANAEQKEFEMKYGSAAATAAAAAGAAACSIAAVNFISALGTFILVFAVMLLIHR